MLFMIRFVAMAAGFATVMLASSLLVMFVVRTLHYLANERGRGLVQMLADVNGLFRSNQGDIVRPGDVAQSDFVLDVLEHRTIDLIPGDEPLPPVERHGPKATRKAIAIAQERRSIELSDVLAVVERLCESSSGRLLLPARWSHDLPPDKRTFEQFRRFATEQYETAEKLSTLRFRMRSKKLSFLVSAFFVVLVNLDSFQLATSLFADSSTREALQQAAPLLLEQADEEGDPHDPDSLGGPAEKNRFFHEVGDKMLPHNTLLSHEGLNLGWADSRIAQLLERAPGRRGSSPPLDWSTFFGEAAFWFLGLLVSWGLVSQGPPFWADLLRRASSVRGLGSTAS